MCAECAWTGWLSPVGCIQNTAHPIAISCPQGQCEDFSGECAPSVFGTRCRQCLYRGYLSLHPETNWPICTCYDSSWNSQSYCRPSLLVHTTTLNMSTTFDSVKCIAFQSMLLGCFHFPQSTARYGETGYLRSATCCDSIFGPPPGQLAGEGSQPWQECNTLGTFDPDEAVRVSFFRTCSGHGEWNRDAYECECDAKWSAVAIGYNQLNGMTAFSCRTCYGFWGPKPLFDHALDEVITPHCTAHYFPDETGTLSECGGHGTFQETKCICFQNPEDGFWDARMFSSSFIRVLGNGTSLLPQTESEWTCSVCSTGYSGSKCTLGPVLLNTVPPSKAPVAPMCAGCFSYGPTALLSTEPMLSPNISFSSPLCCSATGIFRAPGSRAVTVTSGTCLQSDDGKRHLASQWCSLLNGCIAYTWTNNRFNVDFWFAANASFSLVLSSKSGSGLACPVSASPTKSPTMFPTAFPVAQ